jgi:hypothetical protein
MLPTASFATPFTLSDVLLMVFLLEQSRVFGHYVEIDPRLFGRVSIILRAHFIAGSRFGFMFCGQPTRMRGTFRLQR